MALFIVTTMFFMIRCTNNAPKETEATGPTPEEMVARGKYLVTIVGCEDCHSPKIFGANGTPVPDPNLTLSGHPATAVLPPVDATEVTPGKWYLASADLTAWVGPWGISYTANLTPDETGIGNWSEQNFMDAIRKGKHLGLDGGRPILPPMPWQQISQMTDDDLKSVFAYLQSLKPISNLVPTPVLPEDLGKMGVKQ